MPMSKGLVVNGCAGSRKTTLGKEVAKQLNFHHTASHLPIAKDI